MIFRFLERRRLHDAFGRFLPSEKLAEIEKATISGTEAEAFVRFLDWHFRDRSRDAIALKSIIETANGLLDRQGERQTTDGP